MNFNFNLVQITIQVTPQKKYLIKKLSCRKNKIHEKQGKPCNTMFSMAVSVVNMNNGTIPA